MSEENSASTITIDGKPYDLANLSDTAKMQIASLQVVDQKIAEAQQTIAIMQTARNAYIAALKDELPE